MCLASGILQKGGKLPCPVDASGKFTSEVSDFQGLHVKVQFDCGVFFFFELLCTIQN